MEVPDVNMYFATGESSPRRAPSLERALLDVLIGGPRLFPRRREVELGWRILDPVEDFWGLYTKAGTVSAVRPARRRPTR